MAEALHIAAKYRLRCCSRPARETSSMSSQFGDASAASLGTERTAGSVSTEGGAEILSLRGHEHVHTHPMIVATGMEILRHPLRLSEENVCEMMRLAFVPVRQGRQGSTLLLHWL